VIFAVLLVQRSADAPIDKPERSQHKDHGAVTSNNDEVVAEPLSALSESAKQGTATVPASGNDEVSRSGRIGLLPAQEAVPSSAPVDFADVVVAAVSDTARPLEERQRMITEISRRRDAEALDALKRVAEARVYLNYKAVEAMENFLESPQHLAAAAYVRAR